MLYAVYLYLLGASLQRASEAIEPFVARSRVAVHDWVQRLGAYLREHVRLADGPVPDVVVVDETALHIGDQYWKLWVAIDPDTRAIVHLALSRWPSRAACRTFFDEIRDRYGAYPDRVVTDRGPAYVAPLRRLGIAHDIVAGGIRSYVERWHQTLKDRSQAFRPIPPLPGWGLRSDACVELGVPRGVPLQSCAAA